MSASDDYRVDHVVPDSSGISQSDDDEIAVEDIELKWNVGSEGGAAPWSRTSRSHSQTSSRETNTTANNAGQKIARDVFKSMDQTTDRMLKDIDTMFKAREASLEHVYQQARFYNIEHFLAVEFDQQRDDLNTACMSAIMTLSRKDITASSAGSNITLTWYEKALLKYENFFRKARVIRGAFLRTFEFFKVISEANLSHIQDKHAREVTMLKAAHSMKVANDPSEITSTHLEFAQMRERQALDVSHMREMNENTAAWEMSLLEFHLKCNEDIAMADINMWRTLQQRKVRDRNAVGCLELKLQQHVKSEEDHLAIQHNSALEEMGKNLDARSREVKAQEREASRKKRHQDFYAHGTSIASDALYKLTFASHDAYYASDSNFDSCDSEDESYDHVHSDPYIEIVMLRRQQRRQLLDRRSAMKKSHDAQILALHKAQHKERKKLMDSMRADIDRMHAMQVDKHEELKRNRERLQMKLRDTHKSAAHTLRDKQTREMYKLLEEEKQKTITASVISDAKAQEAMSNHVFHEMRNVLSSMLAIADNMADDPAMQDMALRQRSMCQYAVETMDTMLDVTLYQGGMYKLRKSGMKLTDLFDNAMMLQGDRVAHGVALSRIAPEVKYDLDSHVLTQLLVNLLSNSSKVTKIGQIRVVAREVVNGKIELGVSDTGPGMVGAVNALAFPADPDEYKRRSCGYGLYLVHLIAKSMEADLAVLTPVPAEHWTRQTSEGGPGAYVSLRFECSRSVESELATEVVADDNTTTPPPNGLKCRPSGRWRIMVADDQRLVRVFSLQLLSRLVQANPNLSLEVITVQSCEEAARAEKQFKPDLILMDAHFDQTLLQTRDASELERFERPTLVLEAGMPVAASALIRDFTKNERFDIQPGDGVALGTEFVYVYDGDAICVLATGSPIGDVGKRAIIMKPYTLEGFCKEMERAYAECDHFKQRVEKDEENGNIVLKGRGSGMVVLALERNASSS
ncbi:hypothetical protein JKP88DRAFT_244921 [Tribonema minus]|uniref:Histidine kinase domain-containing protein n=1 Tax=Tribonema minus TaxID=303371 RepID=A0A835YZ43_9STRA|nr:hypothetical protein JKP88DRAFT_244921 [Tribonema minus]